MASKVVDRIDPFHNKASIKGRKQKRSQGSSHYRTKGPTELQALPQLRGMPHIFETFTVCLAGSVIRLSTCLILSKWLPRLMYWLPGQTRPPSRFQ